MVYDIDYIANDGNTYTLYDIMFWLKPRKCRYENGQYVEDNTWYSELQCTANGANIAKFVYENINTQECLNDFQTDCKKIEWLRGYLHEEHANYCLPKEEASDMLYHNYLPDIKKVIFDFAEKWNLTINED